jgi:hypothetical protein
MVILGILAAFILAMVVMVPARADQPVHIRIPLDDSGTYPAFSDYNSCEFEIDYVLEGTLNIHEWYDENGDVVRANYNWSGVRNTLSANGKTLFEQDSGLNKQFIVSPTEYILVIHGHSWSIPIPGYGIAYGSIGRWVLRVIHDGDEINSVDVLDRSGLNFEDPTPICDYLRK